MEIVAPTHIPRVYATDGAWDSHRSTITRLYKNENKTLKEVMTTMEREFNFLGT